MTVVVVVGVVGVVGGVAVVVVVGVVGVVGVVDVVGLVEGLVGGLVEGVAVSGYDSEYGSNPNPLGASKMRFSRFSIEFATHSWTTSSEICKYRKFLSVFALRE